MLDGRGFEINKKRWHPRTIWWRKCRFCTIYA